MDSILEDFGIDILEEEIDDVLFKTNEFLTASEFIGTYGPFWYILQISMALAAVFAIIVAGQMAYKMMIKNEPLDVLRIFRPFAVALVMLWWYPPNMSSMIPVNSNFCVLDALAMIPNYIGSYTHDLYEAEASNITDQFEQMQELIAKRDTAYARQIALVTTASTGMSNSELAQALSEQNGAEEVTELQAAAFKSFFTSLAGGLNIALDKILIIFSLIIYRIGWWATIYVQQILLGMLTIFGPIQWAFSLLPKWESAWAKWITRYLTVQFYGAMLYFVSFYKVIIRWFSISYNIENCTKQQTYNKKIKIFSRLYLKPLL